MAAKKASGANIEEWQRRGLKLQFRVTEEERAKLHYLAAREGLTTNEYARRAALMAVSIGWRSSSS